MLTLGKVALTGGLACGKTSACRVLQELGAFVVNADVIVHRLLAFDVVLSYKIVRLLGKDVLINGKLSRIIIADKIFNDIHLLRDFEKLLHPLILSKIKKLYRKACKLGKANLFIVEIPLLYEIGAEKFYDAVIVVSVDEPLARSRYKRAGLSDEEYSKRMQSQFSPKEKEMRAQFIIYNNGTFDELRQQVINLFPKLLNIYTKTTSKVGVSV